MKKSRWGTTKIIIAVMVAVITVLFIVNIFTQDIPEGAEFFPRREIMEAKNPFNEITAIIVEGEKPERMNYLGSNITCYLKLEYPKSTLLITRDLTDGTGYYEGGIEAVNWLDQDRVLIKRYINGIKLNLIYDTRQMGWTEVE